MVFSLISNQWKPKKNFWSWSCIGRVLLIILFLYSSMLFSISSLFQCKESAAIDTETTTANTTTFSIYEGNLLKLESSWNALSFSSEPCPKSLKIALFVKKWPAKGNAGGLERHALTLHRVLAQRGHQIHVFTGLPTDADEAVATDKSMHFHFTNSSADLVKYADKQEAWSEFQDMNRRLNGFDIIHTESVCLPYNFAQGLNNVVATWHGIRYEGIHSSIVNELTRDADEPWTPAVDRALKATLHGVIYEINFFPNYRHHIATSDYVGEVLRTVYMLPQENIHIILNGVADQVYRPDPHRGRRFRALHGVPTNARLVLGMAGRLVKDKGHPMVFRVLRDIFSSNQSENVFVFIAGNGPWASRYTELGPNVKVLGPLNSSTLGDFYNALDIFVNPTLRAHGLDHTLLEAMMCGKPLLATHFSSITRSVVVSEELGYTFSPTFESLKKGLERVLEDGKDVLEEKGRVCLKRGTIMFIAQKMAASFERLFLCIAKEPNDNVDFCKYPLSSNLYK